jgi:cobalamin biosynthesis protein CobD/CbiB
MTNDIKKLGPKDFVIGCLVIVVAIFVVPLLVIFFKISIHLAIVIGVIVAIVLATALLGRVIRLIFFKKRSDDKNLPDIRP